MEIVSPMVVPDNAKEMKAAITKLLTQIDELREQMRADDFEIAQIRAENTALKIEAQTLGEETRTILANLRSAF